MKQLFHIEQQATGSGQEVLSVRIGKKHACFSVSNKAGTELYDLGYASSNHWDEQELDAFWEAYPSLHHRFYGILVAYDIPDAVFVPTSVYRHEEAAAMLSVGGANTSRANIVSEAVNGWQMNNVYAAPVVLQDWVKKKFPSASYQQEYSLGIRNLDIAAEHGNITVDFRHDDMTVLVARQGKLLLARHFAYSTPEDVLYILLRICHSFGLSQQELSLTISGLIDRQSALYKELYQYFIHIGFREPTWKARSEYPEHFFTTLNDLAQCVS